MIKKYYSSELYHHGIKGQKWGVRRYQNEDGTYTLEGKKRRRIGSDESSDDSSNSWFDPIIKRGKDKSPISPAENVTRNVEVIADSTNDIVDRYKKKPDLSEKTDKELREEIERMQLEQRYEELSKYKDDGYRIASDIIATVGDIAKIAGSVATIYAAYKLVNGK